MDVGRPKVSVLVPNYNTGWCILETLESVLSQTFTDFELIVADDGSSDDSVQLLWDFAKANPKASIIFHKGRANKGMAATYELLISKAKGKYVAFLESDDILEAASLEKRLKVLEENPDCILCFSDVCEFGLEDAYAASIKDHLDTHLRTLRPYEPFDGSQVFHTNFIPTFSCVMVKADCLKGLDFMAPDGFSSWLDHWLWGQLSLRGGFIYVGEKLTRWRLHTLSMNYRYKMEEQDVMGSIQVFRQSLFERFSKGLDAKDKARLREAVFYPGASGLQRLAGYIDSKRHSGSMLFKPVIYVKDILWRLLSV